MSELAAIVYRSSDRPKYVEKTLPLLLERTHSDLPIIVFDNSSFDGRRKEVKSAIESIIQGDDRVLSFYHPESRIGGTKVIVEALELTLRTHPQLHTFMNVDDDVVVPLPDSEHGSWEKVLFDMTLAGWNVVAHPWAQSFRHGHTPREYGGIMGYEYSGVGGGCSAFKTSFYNKHPMEQQTLIRGYNEWMVRWTGGKRCGYSYDGQMVIEHIDRPEHPWSLRDSEYDEWATAMYWERFPNAKGKERPKGSKGVW